MTLITPVLSYKYLELTHYSAKAIRKQGTNYFLFR